MTRIFKNSIHQFHRAIISRNKEGELPFSRRIKRDFPLVNLKQTSNGFILAEAGEHLTYLGTRSELIANEQLLSSRLREFASNPVKHIEKVKWFYNESLRALANITKGDSSKYEREAREAASKIGIISDEQLTADIDAAKKQRRNNIILDKLHALELKSDSDSQRLLHHPFLMKT